MQIRSSITPYRSRCSDHALSITQFRASLSARITADPAAGKQNNLAGAAALHRSGCRPVLDCTRPDRPGTPYAARGARAPVFLGERARRLGADWRRFLALGASPQSLVLPLGLPDLPFHLRLDALSAFFVLLLGRRSVAPRCSAPVTSSMAAAATSGSSACSITCSSLRWCWCCWPMTPTRSCGVGVDGTCLLLPRHHRSPHCRNPQRGLPLPADRARRRHRDPARFRRSPAWPVELHLRRDARERTRAHWAAVAFCWRCWVSAPKRVSCRCTYGCPRRIPPRLRRCPP